jgi:peptidoglycan/LPS O-acetylase OafA/YrhL
MPLHNSAPERNNNFNLIRIYLSLSVVFFHCYELSGSEALHPLLQFFNGETAVSAFFIISGFLIMKSFQRSRSSREFIKKRIKRIYPAYFVIVVLCAAGGYFISTSTFFDYFFSPGLYSYLAANLSFLNFIEPTLPGVFTTHRLAAVNGSLWTLKIEVSYYLVVPLIAFIRSKMNGHVLYSILFAASMGYFIVMTSLYRGHNNEIFLFLSRQLPGQLFYFILGAWMTELYNKAWFLPALRRLGIPALIAFFFPLHVAAESILITIVIFFLAYAIPVLRYPFKNEDISYGTYIYHFPVIQVLIHYHLFDYSPRLAVVIAVTTTIILAILSWFFVEKPMIKKRRRRQETPGLMLRI